MVVVITYFHYAPLFTPLRHYYCCVIDTSYLFTPLLLLSFIIDIAYWYIMLAILRWPSLSFTPLISLSLLFHYYLILVDFDGYCHVIGYYHYYWHFRHYYFPLLLHFFILRLLRYAAIIGHGHFIAIGVTLLRRHYVTIAIAIAIDLIILRHYAIFIRRYYALHAYATCHWLPAIAAITHWLLRHIDKPPYVIFHILRHIVIIIVYTIHYYHYITSLRLLSLPGYYYYTHYAMPPAITATLIRHWLLAITNAIIADSYAYWLRRYAIAIISWLLRCWRYYYW